MSRICLYYVTEPEKDRWIPGDRFLRPAVRRIVRGRPRPGGLDKVFINLCLGLDRLGEKYEVNLPFRKLRPDDRVGVLGRGKHCLAGYSQSNPIVAGIGLMTHPSEWPTLCEQYPVARYLQHSAWCDAVYRPWFGNRCAIWPVGIDTASWIPSAIQKTTDFLIYDKIHWDYDARRQDLLSRIESALIEQGLSVESLRYGQYAPTEYKDALTRCRGMIFLSAHESQGIAYQEALATGVPVLAWDPGFVQDPQRFIWNEPEIPATSVPYFDERCGMRFRDYPDFAKTLPAFLDRLRLGRFNPRDYIVENLTVEKCSRHFVEFLDESRRLSQAVSPT